MIVSPRLSTAKPIYRPNKRAPIYLDLLLLAAAKICCAPGCIRRVWAKGAVICQPGLVVEPVSCLIFIEVDCPDQYVLATPNGG